MSVAIHFPSTPPSSCIHLLPNPKAISSLPFPSSGQSLALAIAGLFNCLGLISPSFFTLIHLHHLRFFLGPSICHFRPRPYLPPSRPWPSFLLLCTLELIHSSLSIFLTSSDKIGTSSCSPVNPRHPHSKPGLVFIALQCPR